ncbi:MAG: beta-phosphoglucomutase [Saprospiraceae bacterium]
MIKACIFDLDGVLVDTAKYHFRAWRRLANELGFDFTEKENEQLKGVGRMQSLDLILQWGGVVKSVEEKQQLAAMKNEWYIGYIAGMTPGEVLDGVPAFLDELKAKGVKIALGSASKNARAILRQAGLTHYFGAMIDGNKTTKGKPDPQVFQLGAEALGVAPAEAIVFEDAQKGIEAALAGGFWAIGIGAQEDLKEAHAVIPGFKGYDFEKILMLLRR